MNKRPTGVTIMAVIVIVGALLGIYAGNLGLDGDAAAVGSGIGILIVSSVQLLVGIGLWTLRKWAWTLAVVVLGIRVILDIVGIVTGAAVVAGIINLIVSLILLWYLFRPNVQRAFGR